MRCWVQGVDENTHFAPHVRCEIGAYAWHLIEHLPSTWEEGKQASAGPGQAAHVPGQACAAQRPCWAGGMQPQRSIAQAKKKRVLLLCSAS
jgi:hypothetical protein